MKKPIPPVRHKPTLAERPRSYLTEKEIERLLKACKGARYPDRDRTMILIAFRHGLRVSELCGLQWTDVEFETATLHVRRAKAGETTVQPIGGDEMRALRALKREAKTPFIFVTERGSPFTTPGFASLVERTGLEAKIGFKVHPHMLRHATGYVLANKGTDTRTLQDYLGHKSIASTVRYTKLAPGRFKNLWK